MDSCGQELERERAARDETEQCLLRERAAADAGLASDRVMAGHLEAQEQAHARDATAWRAERDVLRRGARLAAAAAREARERCTACKSKAAREHEVLVARLTRADHEISRLRALVAERDAHAAVADRIRHTAVAAAACASETVTAATSRCNNELNWHTLHSELASERRHRVEAERERDTALGAVDRLLMTDKSN